MAKASKKKSEKEKSGKKSSKSPVVGKDTSLRDLLRIPQGPVDMSALDAESTPGYPGKGKADAPERAAEVGERLSDLQERLYANGREDEKAPRVLVILQGMDTSGKGGVIRHAIGMVDPQGVSLKAFKSPTEEERSHTFLWRIKKALPGAGMIGIFDRSQYEDVLIVRVDELVPVEEWEKRYNQINKFEADLVADGVKVIKCFLNVSHDEQKVRLLERLENPEKYWKYNPGDVDSRSKWPAYMEAYADLLERCNTDDAPWYHIPSNKKWYRNWAVAQLLLETLEEMDLAWPAADFDVSEEIERVNKS
ncbi:PPK2 family polyphosphate kinase [Luteococcus sp. H154]|uniref:PPK2 family polyphosphate kinase n=1 Tax=unclassified Luteococcus TaxID=2639923 RepID=UPI00313B362F